MGPEFQVNLATAGHQGGARVASGPAGEFVVVWNTLLYSDLLVSGRRFDGAGLPLGGEIDVSQHHPSRPAGIGVNGAGGFVVAWGGGSPGPGGGSPGNAWARRFAPDATPLGDQFQVDSSNGAEYFQTRGLAVDPGGSFVVVWDNYGSWCQRYEADGDPAGENLELPGGLPRIASTPSGGFLVVFEATYVDLAGQRFDANGEPAGPVLEIENVPGVIHDHAVDTNLAGEFVVAWMNDSPGAEQTWARSFDAAGTPISDPVLVDSGPHGDRRAPEVGISPDGSFIVSWTHFGPNVPDESSGSVQARRFAANGTPLGPRFQVNGLTEGSQSDAHVDIDDEFAVFVWESFSSAGSDTDGYSVQARLFLLPFFADGVESGDFDRWSGAQP